MGLLTTGGAPMRWGTEENNCAVSHVLAHGIQQFLSIYRRHRNKTDFPFLWGEEIEHQLVRVEGKRVLLSLNAAEVIERLAELGEKENAIWHPEYGSFMVESVPGKPYTLDVNSLCSVEENIRRRYQLLDEFAGENTFALTLVTFPLMGVGQFTTSNNTLTPHSLSLFVPDVCINATHPRFVNLTENIRLRRGRKVCIQVPIFIDTHTMRETVDPRLNIDRTPQNVDIVCNTTNEREKPKSEFFSDDNIVESQDSKHPEHILKDTMTHLYTPATHYYYAQYFKKCQAMLVKQRYEACPCPIPSVSQPCIYMDCMAFGMGSNCLQVTMQLANESQASHIYDQLAILSPLFLALSSSTPFQKGILSDLDVRWLTIAASVDDRKREEVPRIIKSRYDSISVFVSPLISNLEEFNDEEFTMNESYYELLKNEGVNFRLAKHIAHLFIRDPLVVYDQMIDIDDATHAEHFENIQSTNWQTVRLKPPSVEGDIGWRVEFRVMDVMPTPFENAAFSVFLILLTRAIIKYNLLFYTKLSIVDENMGRAHNRNPCEGKYVMRRDIFATEISTDPSENDEFSVDTIINGEKNKYYGLIPIVYRYMEEENIQSDVLRGYLRFISMRASGKLPTAAQYLREFVLQHPDYKSDSRITEEIAHDMVQHIHQLACGKITDSHFLPMTAIATKRPHE